MVFQAKTSNALTSVQNVWSVLLLLLLMMSLVFPTGLYAMFYPDGDSNTLSVKESTIMSMKTAIDEQVFHHSCVSMSDYGNIGCADQHTTGFCCTSITALFTPFHWALSAPVLHSRLSRENTSRYALIQANQLFRPPIYSVEPKS